MTDRNYEGVSTLQRLEQNVLRLAGEILDARAKYEAELAKLARRDATRKLPRRSDKVEHT